MFAERADQRTAPIKGHAGRDAEIGETLAADTERERVLKGLKSCQKSVWLDHDPRAGRGGTGLLEIADEPVHIDGTALIQSAYANVRIDNHDGFDMSRQPLEQAAQGARLA